MSNGENLIAELRRQLDKAEPQDLSDIVRYSLLVQIELLTRLQDLETASKRREIQLSELIDRNVKYPSLMYLWATNPKRVAILVFGIFSLYTAVFSPINFAEWRNAIGAAIASLF